MAGHIPNERAALQRLLGAVGLWGLGFPLGKALAVAVSHSLCRPFDLIDSVVASALRYAFATLCLLILIPSARRVPTRLELLQGGAMGLVLALGVTAMQWGVAQSLASTAAFLTQLYLVFVVAFVLVTRRRLPSAALVAAVIASLAGCAALAGIGPAGFRLEPGVWPLLLSALLGAAQILLIDVPRFRGNRFESVTLSMFAVMALSLTLCLPASGAGDCLRVCLTDPASLGLIVTLASLVTALPFLAMMRYQPSTTPVRASMLYTLEPVVASIAALCLPGTLSAVLGISYPNERWTPRLLIGAILILGGNLILARSQDAR